MHIFFPSGHSKILGLNQIVSCITHSDLLAIHLLTMSKTIIIKALNYYIIPNVLGHLRACYPVWKLLVPDSTCEGSTLASCISFFHMPPTPKDVCQ